MRLTLIALVCLTACSDQANHLGNPLFLPISGISTAIGNAAYDARRGEVEVIVKSNHPTLLNEIADGGGPVLTQAMDTARVPVADRPARIIQMRGDIGLYTQAPGALVTALMVYGG